jgi:hypothetical protein
MATNTYSYGSLGERFGVGNATTKSSLDLSRIKNDANRWTLQQLVTDPDNDANFALNVASVTGGTISGTTGTFSGRVAINGQNTTHEANSLRIGQEGSGLAQFRAYGPDTSNRGSIEFVTDLSNGTASVRHITLKDVSGSSGVGVGTQSPLARIHTVLGTASSYTPAGNTQAIFEHTAASDSIARVGIIAGQGTGFSVLDFGDSTGPNNGGITYKHETDEMFFATTNGTTKMSIDSSGNLLIGTSSVYGTNLLNVNGGIAIDGRGAATPGLCEKSDFDTGVYWPTTNTIGITNGGSESLRVDSSNQLLVGYTSSQGSYKLQVNSQIFATNATVATSDGRYKEDVQTLSNASDLVSRLNPVQFKWKAHEIHNLDVGKTDVGFIAQEVQAVLSDTDYSDSVVVTNEVDDEKYLGLGETKLIPLLTAAIQELTQRVKELESN